MMYSLIKLLLLLILDIYLGINIHSACCKKGENSESGCSCKKNVTSNNSDQSNKIIPIPEGGKGEAGAKTLEEQERIREQERIKEHERIKEEEKRKEQERIKELKGKEELEKIQEEKAKKEEEERKKREDEERRQKEAEEELQKQQEELQKQQEEERKKKEDEERRQKEEEERKQKEEQEILERENEEKAKKQKEEEEAKKREEARLAEEARKAAELKKQQEEKKEEPKPEEENKEKNDIEEPKEEDYSYDCTNSMYLTAYIYEGTDEAKFEIFLRNNSTKIWGADSKLIIDPSSFLKTDIISLAPQKPNEERGYEIIIKDLGKRAVGEYKLIYLFYTEGKVRGEKITAIVKIKEKDNKKSEVEENMEKINEFRDYFKLSVEEYSDEKLFEVLNDNSFNQERAFSALFP